MRAYEHGGDIYRNEGVDIDFSVNTNALGMPGRVKEELGRSIESFSRYPDPRAEALSRAIAAHEGVAVEDVLCGNGAADLIYRICFVLRPKRALLPAPTFSEYERALSLINCRIDYHDLAEEEQFAVTSTLAERIHGGLDMLFLCQPNNPTGRLIAPDRLEAVLLAAKSHKVTVVVDECFLDFTDGRSVKTFLEAMPNLIVLRALTKTYALAGLRIGYMITKNRPLLERVSGAAQCWSVSVPAQIAGVAALETEGWLEKTRALVETERPFLAASLSRLGLTVYPSDANYLLFRSDVLLYDRLLAHGLLIRRCGNYRGLDERYYRVAVRTREENLRLVEALALIL